MACAHPSGSMPRAAVVRVSCRRTLEGITPGAILLGKKHRVRLSSPTERPVNERLHGLFQTDAENYPGKKTD